MKTTRMNQEDSVVSKSIFYSPQIAPNETTNDGLSKTIHVIESKILPSRVTSVSSATASRQLLKCDQCSYKSYKKSHLTDHQRYVHLKAKVICDLCGKEFSNINQHMRVVHKILRSGLSSKKQCQECLKEFYDLTKHMAKAHSLRYEYDYACHLCLVKCSSKFSLQRHMERKHGHKSKCQECGKSVSNIDAHIKKMHTQCSICHEKITKKSHICSQKPNNHLNIYEDVSIDNAEAMEASEYSITKQLLSLSPVQPEENAFDFQAGDQFLGTQNFIISAGEDIEFILDNVEAEETVVATEETEEVIYSGEKGTSGQRVTNQDNHHVTYKCDLCNYSTNRSTNYHTHYKMVHLKSKTLCQLCGKEYSNINQHLRVIHKVLRSGVTQRRRCETCHQEFYDLEQHRRRAHGQVTERVARCEECGETFSKYANMIRHKKRIHEHRRVRCPECGKEVSNIDKHRKIHQKNKEGDKTQQNRQPQCV